MGSAEGAAAGARGLRGFARGVGARGRAFAAQSGSGDRGRRAGVQWFTRGKG